MMNYPKYESYKDSGIDWLGETPKDWSVNRFKFLCNISTGGKNTEDKVTNGLYSFYVRSQTPERINTYSFDGEAILTAGDGAGVGKVYHYVNEKFDIHQRVYKFCFFKKVKGKLLYYYLMANFYNVAILGTAKSTVDSLRLPLIQNFPIAYPLSIEQQELIIKFLDHKTAQIDEAISIKEKQIELLKEQKQIMIQNAVTKGLDPNVKMKDSGIDWIGEIPEHWELRKAKWLFLKQERSVEENDEIITCFRDGEVTLRKNRRLEGFTNALKEHGYQGIRKGDLVIHAMDAFAGAIGVSDSDGKSTPVYSACIERHKNLVDPYYYAYFLRGLALRGFIESLAKGIRERSTDFRFNDFAQLFLPLPTINEQSSIVEFIRKNISQNDDGIHLLKREADFLKEYKTTLINSAVTGKIKVMPEMVGDA